MEVIEAEVAKMEGEAQQPDIVQQAKEDVGDPGENDAQLMKKAVRDKPLASGDVLNGEWDMSHPAGPLMGLDMIGLLIVFDHCLSLTEQLCTIVFLSQCYPNTGLYQCPTHLSYA